MKIIELERRFRQTHEKLKKKHACRAKTLELGAFFLDALEKNGLELQELRTHIENQRMELNHNKKCISNQKLTIIKYTKLLESARNGNVE